MPLHIPWSLSSMLYITFLLGLILICQLPEHVQSFAFSLSHANSLSQRMNRSSSLHCICINCKYVTNCAAYHFVEEKHDQPHMTENPTFEPRDGSPTIHVNVRTTRVKDDNGMTEFERMMQEHEQETRLAEAQQVNDANTPLHGNTKYDLTPMTTYEYDVVACVDYVEDMGCWVRNMPQAIKDANPNFVPT